MVDRSFHFPHAIPRRTHGHGMNIFAKLGCRAYQLAFRMAMPILPYRNPEIIESVSDIPEALKKRGIESVLLVTDNFLRASGATAALESALEAADIRCAVYDRTRPNPTVENVEAAREIYIRENCRAIIAFGGGSSMDCAKATGARIAFPNKTLDQLKGLLRVWRKLPMLIAVPTTAGTGSETTVTAVITDPKTHHKYTMNNFTMIPSHAVLDPEVTFSLPRHLTATTGMDALTHAIEAYIGRSTTRETRALALEATKLVFENIEAAYNDGTNRAARANMLRAAHLAGIAFSKSYVGYIHAVAHSLGGQYNIPHGLANSVLLPIVLEDYGEIIHEKLRDMALAAGVANEADSPAAAAGKFIDAIRVLNTCMGIPSTIEGIQPADIPLMARHAAQEANPLYPVPVLMTAKELERYYRKVSA